MKREATFDLHLTKRALGDIQDILNYSTQRWGKRTADKYIDELEAGLERIKSHPNLLREEPGCPSALRFYWVSKHLLVCDVQEKSIVVLTVVHASMDIPRRLAELQPTLVVEVEILRRKLHGHKSKKS